MRTCTGGRGKSVIDYAIRDDRSREKIKRLVMGERVDSDHYSIIMSIEQKEKKRGKREQRKERRIGRGIVGGRERKREEVESGRERKKYREEKRRYKNLCEERKREIKKWKREVRKAKTEDQFWKVINWE